MELARWQVGRRGGGEVHFVVFVDGGAELFLQIADAVELVSGVRADWWEWRLTGGLDLLRRWRGKG